MNNVIEIRFIKFDESEKRDVYNLSRWISPKKKHKISKFKNDADFNRSLYAEIIVRDFFCEKLSLDNSEINMEYDIKGKPFIKNFSDLCFSISHSGCYVIVAFAYTPVGIDVEKIKQIDYKGISDRYLKTSEKKYIFKENFSNSQLEKFYQIWTVKESYVKFKGVGLGKGLNYFFAEKILDHQHEFKVIDQNTNKTYYAKSFYLGDENIFSVCFENPNYKIQVNELDVLKTNFFNNN